MPQGSILGPLLFNIFINDLFYAFDKGCNLYNYADDNTLGFCHGDKLVLGQQLEGYAEHAIAWFKDNGMIANPDKFQAMVLSPKNKDGILRFSISGADIVSSNHIKLLGVYLDQNLSFDKHISHLCKRASRQTYALARICKYLNDGTRISLYHAFIASNFKYCDIAWHFCSAGNTYKLEKMNKRALRIVLNDYNSTYMDMLSAACIPSLYEGRLKSIIIVQSGALMCRDSRCICVLLAVCVILIVARRKAITNPVHRDKGS